MQPITDVVARHPVTSKTQNHGGYLLMSFSIAQDV